MPRRNLEAARRKAGEVVARLHSMKLGKAADLVETAVPETLAYYALPEEHWRRIRSTRADHARDPSTNSGGLRLSRRQLGP